MRWAGWLGWGAAAALVVACGARSELPVRGETPPKPPPSRGPECAVYDSTATLAGLDLFVMVDLSGSMDAMTVSGKTKWEAVRNALVNFVFDASSKGIGISVGFFPKIDATVPEWCTDSITDCGEADRCVPLSTCGGTGALCEDDDDCVGLGNEVCVSIAVCTGGLTLCDPGGVNTCGPGDACVDGGFCENRTVCDPDAYADFPIGLRVLPSGANDVYDVLLDRDRPNGATPTLPALQGVSQRARDHMASDDRRNTIVVLATDGEPSVCDEDLGGDDPDAPIDNLVDVAAATFGDGVRTFVVGVFSLDANDNAADDVDRIAVAGGTEKAFIIDTADSIDEGFRAALNQIRLDATACEFTILADDETPIDYDDVWVRLEVDGEEVWVERRLDASGCDERFGGFYYEPPPEAGTDAVRIVLCPESCALLGAAVERTADVYTTCPAPVP